MAKGKGIIKKFTMTIIISYNQLEGLINGNAQKNKRIN